MIGGILVYLLGILTIKEMQGQKKIGVVMEIVCVFFSLLENMCVVYGFFECTLVKEPH